MHGIYRLPCSVFFKCCNDIQDLFPVCALGPASIYCLLLLLPSCVGNIESRNKRVLNSDNRVISSPFLLFPPLFQILPSFYPSFLLRFMHHIFYNYSSPKFIYNRADSSVTGVGSFRSNIITGFELCGGGGELTHTRCG